MNKRYLVVVLTALLLVLLGAIATNAQTVQQKFEWVIAKKLTVNTDAAITGDLTVGDDVTITGDLTAATASFTTLTAPTVTMTSATTWTVASLTASAATVNGDAIVTGTLGVTGASTLGAVGAGAVTATGLTVNGSATITGSGNIGGHLDVLDYFSVSGETYFISGDAWTVTDGSVITPTGTLMELTAAGPVGAELSACGDGQLLTLINTANQTITISETTGFKSAGNFAMGQYDTLTVMGVGVTCYELARSNN